MMLARRGKRTMDLNLTVIAGKLAAEPELVLFESGSRLLRMLVTTRTQEPRRRIDVIPVVMWEPDEDTTNLIENHELRGTPVWVAGSTQRRFWASGDGRTSRIEVVAHQVNFNYTPATLEQGMEAEGIHED